MTTSTTIASEFDDAVETGACAPGNVPHAPLEPAALSRFLAVAAVAGAQAERFHNLPPEEIRKLITTLARVSFPDAIAIACAATP
jgi:hypothetical protein